MQSSKHLRALVAAALSSFALAACQSTNSPGASPGPSSTSSAEKPGASQQEAVAAASLAISMNLAKACPQYFALTRDTAKIAEAERLKSVVGLERFNKGLRALSTPTDCRQTREQALAIKANLPFSEIR